LHAIFGVVSLDKKELYEISFDFNRFNPRIIFLWLAIDTMLAGLSVQKAYPYKHNFSTAKQKVSVMIPFETCVALDNYVYCIRAPISEFRFSPDLQGKSGARISGDTK